MNKKDWTIQLMDKLAGEMSEKKAAQFEAETKQDKQLAEEYQFFTEAWSQMEEFQVPAPENSLSQRFYNRLESTIEKEENALPTKIKARVNQFFNSSHLVRNISLGMLLLAVGFILGGKWNKKTITVNQTTVHATPSDATGQQYASYVPTTQKIQQINQILQTINNDEVALEELKQVVATEKNTNVKLAALRQISKHYAFDNKLKQFIVAQVQREQSPLVQVELLNLLIDNNQSKETIQTMESMLNRRQLNPVVQEKIRNELPVLRASYVN